MASTVLAVTAGTKRDGECSKIANDGGSCSHNLPEEPVPDRFLDPITFEVMHNPVVAADGYHYDLSFIGPWLERNSHSPMATITLPHKMLNADRNLKKEIDEFLGRASGRTLEAIKKYIDDKKSKREAAEEEIQKLKQQVADQKSRAEASKKGSEEQAREIQSLKTQLDSSVSHRMLARTAIIALVTSGCYYLYNQFCNSHKKTTREQDEIEKTQDPEKRDETRLET